MTGLPSFTIISRLGLLIFLLGALIACRPNTQQAAQPIPTVMRLPGITYPIESAERVAREFLQNWQDSNYEFMFNLLSYPSQETTSLTAFTTLYTNAQTMMTLNAIEIAPNAIYQSSDSVAILTYNINFSTELFGTFGDVDRNLTLIADERAQDWRVSWTPSDLFPELAQGGRLLLRQTPPNRGNIYDQEGRTLADQNGRVVTLQIVRQNIVDYMNCLNAISAALSRPVAELQTRIEARPANELIAIGTMDAQTYDTTSASLDQFCRATFSSQPSRRYPSGEVMSHILGYVGYPSEAEIPALQAAGFNADSVIGRTGIELSWDTTLRGRPAGELVIINAAGQVIRTLASSAALPGQSLWLTIDTEFQSQVQQIIADSYTQAKDTWALTSPGASIVVLDVRTGAVLAMVSYPTFDNNAYTAFPPMGRIAAQALIQGYQADSRNPEVNRPAQGLFSLGSVMKTLTAVAAADSGVYALDQRYTCVGTWNRDITRYDWNSGHGTQTLSGAITQSCNPYFYEAGYQMFMADPDILPDYALRVGFGALTGIRDIPEESGFIPTPQWWRTNFGVEMTFSEEVNLAIGQGTMQVTPLQVARWTAAIANNGILYRPYLVERVGLIASEQTVVASPEGIDLGLRPEVLAVIQEGMCAVTTSAYGTAEFVFRNSPIQAIGACGKTGTAQTGSGGTMSHAWFSAYAPASNPEIAVVVMVENSGEGSGVAAPIALRVLEAYFGVAN